MLASVVLSVLVALPFSPVWLASQSGISQQQQVQIEKSWPPAGVFRPGGAVKPPRLIKDIKPNYTAAAMDARITGVVVMEAIVETDGTVGDIRITKSLDRQLGLDDEALSALKKWRFEPGTRDAVAVPVLVVVEMSFTLRK
jgi:TonB family protein